MSSVPSNLIGRRNTKYYKEKNTIKRKLAFLNSVKNWITFSLFVHKGVLDRTEDQLNKLIVLVLLPAVLTLEL